MVLAIILLIAGLLIGAGASLLRDRSRILATSHRMQQVLQGVQLYCQEGADGPWRVMPTVGIGLNLAPLRAVLNTLTQRHGLQLSTAKRDQHLPPNLGNRWEHLAREHWLNPDPGINNAITFRARLWSLGIGSSIDFWMPNHLRPGNTITQLGSTGGRPFGYVESFEDLPATAGDKTFGFPARSATRSVVGESLDRTLEVVPDGVRPPTWYRAQWPNLVEVASAGPDGTLIFTQTAWPESDWDQDPPGTIPPIWSWPWGKPIISRLQATQVNQREYQLGDGGELQERRLDQLSPLASIGIMQAAGTIGGDDGPRAYREQRESSRPWNDSWGSPLVAAFAVTIPPRYDDDDINDRLYFPEAGTMQPRPTDKMAGGRDYFIARSKEVYGYAVAVYLAVGAPGPVLTESLPESWEPHQDAEVLRRLWLQICEVTEADRWNSESFADPPWSGVETGQRGDERCLITVPMEIR